MHRRSNRPHNFRGAKRTRRRILPSTEMTLKMGRTFLLTHRVPRKTKSYEILYPAVTYLSSSRRNGKEIIQKFLVKQLAPFAYPSSLCPACRKRSSKLAIVLNKLCIIYCIINIIISDNIATFILIFKLKKIIKLDTINILKL